MKKKVLLVFIMAMALACVLSISAFAAAYDENRTSIEYIDANGSSHTVPVVKIDGTTPEKVIEGIKLDTSRGHRNSLTALTAMQDDSAYVILADSTGALTAYPSWYIIDAMDDGVVAIFEISYGYLNSEDVVKQTKKEYSEGAIRYIEFPNGMVCARNNGVFGIKQNSTPYETNVTDIYFPSTVTKMESAFNSLPHLKNAYFMPENGITEIPSGTFSNSTVQYVQFENLTNLEKIDGFTRTDLQGDLDLSKTKLKTIKSGAFQYNDDLGKITLPDTVERIEGSAFEYCGSAYLASPYLPTSLTYVGSRFFAYNDNLNETYIFPEGVTQLDSEPFQDSSRPGGPSGKKLNLVFLGKVTGVVYLNGNGHQKHADEVTVYFAQNSLSEYNQNGFKIKPSGSSVTSIPNAIRAVFCNGTGACTNGVVTGVEYIYIRNTEGTSFTSDYVNDTEYGFDFENHTHYGARICTPATCGDNGFEGSNCIICDSRQGEIIPATGNHTYEDDFNCETAVSCDVCGDEVISAKIHTLDVKVTYDKGITAKGVKYSECTNEGCNHSTSEEAVAVIKFLGYSAKQRGDNICVGYAIDEEMLELYGKEFNIGIVVSVPKDEAGKSPLYIEEGNIKGVGKTIVAPVSLNHTAFNFKICNFTEEHYNTELVMCAYLVVDNEISYLCGGANGFGEYESATTITFNSKATEE